MENLQVKKYIKILGWITAFLWFVSAFGRLFFRKEYTREMDDDVSKIMLVLFGLYLFLNVGYELKYNRENFISIVKERFKEMWLQLFFIISLFLLWFLYKRNLL
ncbi:hypothetical protein SAMN05192550_0806 [Flavobacterium glycines]|uniref:Uncharacterized protein n=1 Tax=Flavobacterium glycines TaxID=551990 RepID=A0A1B9DTL7_9FLAO|nr:hypothetical protein [Flavobacterium glycines]OCB73026.1 hypothetical protein FBGL_03910 [Flavobacterium glycines]GEL10169.1 hypothetical protein FGL01_09080 [Flavobacterium glycines]SDI78585.1 hypothetical protein SAMN05192550_0806 [Flavobacterium glycines]